MHLVRIGANVVFTFPIIIVFTPRGHGGVKEPAFRRVPPDLFRMIEREIGESDFTKHCLLECGPDEGVELAMAACQGCEENSEGLIIELVGEDDFSAVLDHDLVIPCVNGTGYLKG